MKRTKISAIAEARLLALEAGYPKDKVDRMVRSFMSSPEGWQEADAVCVDLDPAFGPPAVPHALR